MSNPNQLKWIVNWSVVYTFMKDATHRDNQNSTNLKFIKRLQALHSASLLLRDQPKKEIIHIQTNTLVPALETNTAGLHLILQRVFMERTFTGEHFEHGSPMFWLTSQEAGSELCSMEMVLLSKKIKKMLELFCASLVCWPCPGTGVSVQSCLGIAEEHAELNWVWGNAPAWSDQRDRMDGSAHTSHRETVAGTLQPNWWRHRTCKAHNMQQL